MSNLFLKNFHLVLTKLKLSPPPTAPSSDCYFTSNPISSTAADDAEVSISDEYAAVFAYRRFFFSSPGRSNSILDSSDARRRSHHRNDDVVSEGLKVPKYSRDPYGDFRRSMQEMVEARELENVRTDWEFLRHLLSSYLRLNPNNTHKFIVKAFADLVLSLLASSSPAPPPPPTCRKFLMFRES